MAQRTGMYHLKERKIERHEYGAGMHADGGGLYLRVADGGSQQYVFRYKMGKKSGKVGLGPTRLYTLEEARAKAKEFSRMKREGITPPKTRQHVAQQLTFNAVAEQYIVVKAPEWTYAAQADDWRSAFKKYAPKFMELPVATITRQDVLALLEPIWPTEQHKIAKLLQYRIEAILDFATVKEYRSGENPARWKHFLDKVLKAPAKVKAITGRASIPWQDMPALVANLRHADTLAAMAAEFVILTGARFGEVIKMGTKPGLQWDWIDMTGPCEAPGPTVTFPAAVMKNRVAHRVPLSDRCLAILERAGDVRSNKDGRVFPMSETPIRKLWEHLAPDYDLHGCRSTMTDCMRDHLGIADKDVRDKCIAHYEGSKTDKAYNRSDLLKLRRPAMQAWATYCQSA